MAHILPSQPDGPSLQETTEKIVNELKSRGNFDTFRKACLADVDTRPAYQNLRQRVETTVTTFLGKQKWTPDLNRNQLREKLRKHLAESRFLEIGVDRIVDQVVDRNIYTTYMPQIQLLVKEMLDIKDEAEDKIDDDVEMEEATPAPETGGNTFGTWANQFHARVPEPRPDETTVAASNSSMSISSATNESAAGSASEADSPDIRAQMSPLSDDGKQGWGSFLGKADELDFSGIMNRVGHMDPAIDQMIKSELEADTRETDASALPAPAQRSGSSNSNMSLEEEEPVDLQSFVGPPESVDSQDGHRWDADREPPLPPRPPRDEPDRGGRVDMEPRGGRHPSDEERRRRERERDRDRDRDRDRGRRERSRHDEERSRHGDEDRYRRDRDRDRDRERDRDRDRWDRDRGDDHEEQRNRGRHHQRRDRDDDDPSGHRGRSGGHSHGGRGHGREDDRGGGGGGGGGSGQRYYGYGSGRERPAGNQGEVVDGVVEVVVESGQEAEMEDETVKIESEEVGKVGTSVEREGAVKKDTSRERKDTSKDRDRKATSKERDRKMSGSGSRKRESSSTHKKSSRRHDRSSERRSSSKKTGSSEKHAEKSRKLAVSVERLSTNTPSSSPTSPSENKPPASTSNDIVAESMPKTKVDSINSSLKGDIKPSNAIKSSSSSEVSSSRKSESSKHKSHVSNSNDKLLKVAAKPVGRMSKSVTNDQASKSSSSTSKSSTSGSTKSERPWGELNSDRNAPLNAKDRMAQLMEKYAPYLKDRSRRSANTSKREPKPTPKAKAPQNTYLGESKRPSSPSLHSSVQCLRQVVAEPDALSVSSVDTADLSDFDDRLEMELELTEPERETLLRIGWQPVVDDLADIDDDILASATGDLVQVVDLADDVESVDSGFNRSDASSSTSAGSAHLRLTVATADEPPLIDLEPSPADGRRRRQRKVDYIALNSGLDGEDKVAVPTRRRRRPRDDCDWSPSVKVGRMGPSPSVQLVPRVSLLRLPEMKPLRTPDKEEWHVSSDKENMDGMTRLRDPGAAGDSVRIRPNLAI